MAGESLQTATLTPLGLEGDRTVQVRNALGRAITAKTHPALLEFKATLDGNGTLLINGIPWDDAEVLKAVRKVAGAEACLVRDAALKRNQQGQGW
jgi:uncharacterized protein YcbX